MDRPLEGQRVVVTRTRQQASALVVALDKLGATTIEVPTIAIEPPADGGAAAANAIAELSSFAWVVVTSPNGAWHFCKRLTDSASGDVAALPPGVRLAAVGPSTARQLEQAGLSVDLLPDRFVAESLVEAFGALGQPPPANRVLLAVAEVTRPTLADGLGSQGWDPHPVPFYRTVPAPISDQQLRLISTATAVTFTSSSTVEQFLSLVGSDALPSVVACIGPITAATARQRGLTVQVEASEHTIAGLVTAFTEYVQS